MLRIHCVQLFYNLSDPGMEDMLYEVDRSTNRHSFCSAAARYGRGCVRKSGSCRVTAGNAYVSRAAWYRRGVRTTAGCSFVMSTDWADE